MCCNTGELNTEDNNWEVNEINYFVGRQLNNCENFNIQEFKNLTLKVIHSGPDGSKIHDIKILSSKHELDTFHKCIINKKLDNDQYHKVLCNKNLPTELYENSCNGNSKFCSLKFNRVTFAGAHNAGTGKFEYIYFRHMT